MSATRLYLVRHGATNLTAEDRFSGHVGVDLSDEGRWQAKRLSERLVSAGITAAYCSPLSRTVETAQIIAAPLGLESTVIGFDGPDAVLLRPGAIARFSPIMGAVERFARADGEADLRAIAVDEPAQRRRDMGVRRADPAVRRALGRGAIEGRVGGAAQ